MIHCSISYERPNLGFIDINLSFAPKGEKSTLQLASWRPGRYELANYAQNIQRFEATDKKGLPLPFEKTTKDRWEIHHGELDEVRISYNYFARQMDAGGSWLDDEQLYINFINCIPLISEMENEGITLKLSLPSNYQIACALPQITDRTLLANNYQELVDSPLFSSANLQHNSYSISEHTFHLWFQGNVNPDWETLKKDFIAFTETQMKLFGGFPSKDYHFLYQILPYKHYHGVEHQNSTVITLGPNQNFFEKEFRSNLLGVSSHELFHAWNVCRIRPIEMMPYDFSKEAYHTTGYITEGLTTYYGDLMLARSGVFTKEEYFEEINRLLTRHFENYGRHNLSIVDSSFDLWLDGYKMGIPDRKVSIYVKGALLALLLDLTIRQETNDQKSLDTVMKRLWQDHGATGKGYSPSDYQNICEEVIGRKMDDYFRPFIEGNADLKEPISQALTHIGCTLAPKPASTDWENIYGFKTSESPTGLKVIKIAPSSPASAQLSIGDIITNPEPQGNVPSLTLNIDRFGRQLQITLHPEEGRNHFQTYTIQQLKQTESFDRWLSQE